MKLSLCMIVRDNEDTLAACLNSIKPWVDEMIVVDTGSLDATREIAEQCGAMVSSFVWIDDFSAARNASLEGAQGEWIFWMDSDDTMPQECGRRLRDLADAEHPENVFGFVMQVHCPNGETTDDYTVVDHVKLFRNDPRIRFEGRIHEQVLMPIRLLRGEVQWTDIHVVHSGAKHTPAARAGKYERDLRILFKDLQERPDHPFVQFNLGMTYADMGEYDRAIEHLQASLELSELHESHVRKAFALMASCHYQAERFQQSLAVCRQGRAAYTDDPELLFREGMALHSLGDHGGSIECYQEALRQPRQRYFQSVDPGIAGYKCRHNLAVVYREGGQLEMAELQWRLILDDHPRFQPALMGLAELLIDANRLATARVEAQRLLASSDAPIVGAIQMARLEEKEGRAGLALELLERYHREYDESEDLLQELSRLTFEMGESNKAKIVLAKLAKLKPADASAHFNLGTLHWQDGDLDLALSAYETSLALRPHHRDTQQRISELKNRLMQA